MIKSDSIKELATALSAFQKDAESVPKDATNPFFKSKYASLENIISHVRPHLAKHGLSFTQLPDEKSLFTVLMHKSGEHIGSWAFMGAKDDTPQAIGSAITYMRRYALSAILGLATEEDDDGEATKAKGESPLKVAEAARIYDQGFELGVAARTKEAHPKLAQAARIEASRKEKEGWKNPVPKAGAKINNNIDDVL